MPPLFRADQVGSLIRPSSLLDARKSLGIYSDDLADDQGAATSAAIAHAVKKQLELDVRPITSGEYERTIFYSGFFEKLQGMETRHDLIIPDDFRTEFPTTQGLAGMGVTKRSAVIAAGKIRHLSSAYLSGWNMLKDAVPSQYWKDCKMAMPSITWEHMQLAKGSAYTPEAYTSDREYLGDLASAFRAEIKVLYEAGLRSVQVDDPNMTFFVFDKFRDGLRKDGVDPEELLDLYIWAHNEAIKDRPGDLHIGVHLCRGNFPGTQGFAQGSYEKIAEKVFTRLNYDTFYLEFDDARSGSFDCLRFLPRGKNAVLGLVSTKKAELENLESLKGRVYEAAQIIADSQNRTTDDVLRDSLAVSPQCGFASIDTGRAVATEERMWEKLALTRDLARQVWKDSV